MNSRIRLFSWSLLAILFLPSLGRADDDDEDRTTVAGAFVTGPVAPRVSPPRTFGLSDLDELIDQLESPSEDDRHEAAYALGRLGPAAFKAESGLVRQLSDSDIRSVAARALLRIGADPTPILSLLSNDDLDARADALQVLLANRIELPRVIPHVLRLATGSDCPLRDVTSTFSAFGPRAIATVTPILIKLLGDDNPSISDQAYFALSSLSDLPDSAVTPLAELLASPRSNVRLHAAKLLNNMEERAKAAEPAMRRLLQDSCDDVRVEAAAFVARLQADDVEPISVLTAVADRGPADGEAAHNAVLRLGELGERSLAAVPVIVRGLGASDHWTSWWAHEALVKIGPKAMPAVVDNLRWWQRQQVGWRCRVDSLRVLGAFGTTAQTAHAAILTSIESGNAEEQVAAIGTLADIQIRDRQTIERLNSLLAATQAEVRAAAALALGRLATTNDAGAISALQSALVDKADSVRLAAVEALFHLTPDSPAIAATLTELLRVEEPQIVVDACDLIAKMQAAAAPSTAQLIKTLESEKFVAAGFSGHPIRQTARYALGEIGKPAVQPLINALGHPNAQVRGLAAEALSAMGQDAQAAVPKLIELLDDRDTWMTHMGCMGYPTEVRAAASSALGKMGSAATPALPRLILLIGDEALCDTAISAVGEIGPPAKDAIPALVAVKTDDDVRLNLAVTRALLNIDPEYPLVDRLRRLLDDFENNYSDGLDDWSSMSEVADLLVRLGPRAHPIKPILKHMIQESEFLPPDYRGEAAYALAVLEPQNPAWRATLTRIVVHDHGSLLEDRLEELAGRKK